MIDLMASRLFSDFPLAVSPLQCRSVSGAYCVGDGSAPEQNRLVLVRPAHVVVRIVRELEDMRGQRLLLLAGVPVVGRVFEHDGVGVGGDVFVRVKRHQRGGAYVRVDAVVHEPLPQAGDDGIVGDGRQRGEVGDRLELLVGRHGRGGPPVHGEKSQGMLGC